MYQLFIKPSRIDKESWENAYFNIKSMLEHFPTKIIRIESPPIHESGLNKIHFDLVVEKGTDKEHLSFWGDWMGFSGRGTFKLYKNWDKQVELKTWGEEIDETKPVAWYKDMPYKNDGDIPRSNGIMLVDAHYLDTEGACYESVLIGMGILLENEIPQGTFMTLLWGRDIAEVEAVLNWLEHHFNRRFNKPKYFDKPELLKLLMKAYDTKKEVICRLAHLYRKRHKYNMQFAIEHLGYKPTLEFYTAVLADTGFGTFGFSDVLDPWIAATEDLESTLELITASKNWLLRDSDDEYNIKEAGKYDLTWILKQLLNSYILWTPAQREQLAHFYNNKEALETGEEDLMGTMKRMLGYRIDICPIYADKEVLFEAFMYHDPKNGKAYKAMIDDWVQENDSKYDKLSQEIENLRVKHEEKISENYEEKEIEQVLEREQLKKSFLDQYAAYEQHFVKKALKENPLYLEIEDAVKGFKERVIKGVKNYSDQVYLEELKSLPKESHIRFIKSRIREVGYKVHPKFEAWLEALEDEKILFYFHFAMALKLYDEDSFFARFRFLWDKKYWEDWKE